MSILLLNDTDEEGAHFGCLRVMRTIRAELARRGLSEPRSIKVRTDWRRDPEARQLVESARLAVINGEGTLHHGKRSGRWLMEAGAEIKARGGSVALINALWQDNPEDWARLASGFDLLSCRDSRSAAALSALTGRAVGWLGDLSMLDPVPEPPGAARTGVLVSCSVAPNVTRRLEALAAGICADYVPVTRSAKTVSPRLTGLPRFVRATYARLYASGLARRLPQARLVADDAAYLGELARHRLLVTGRFHSVCLALASGTPFIAVASNSWKIGALIADAGLDAGRQVPLAALTPDLVDRRDWSFAAAERAALAKRLADWRAEGAALFGRIAALAGQA